MHLEDLDGELCICDENEIVYTFERGDLSRGAYKHMCGWVKKNFDQELEPTQLWRAAEAAWDDLTPEQQMLLWSLSVQEQQNAQDICTGLLATLYSYQGLTIVKQAFKESIEKVLEKFTSS